MWSAPRLVARQTRAPVRPSCRRPSVTVRFSMGGATGSSSYLRALFPDRAPELAVHRFFYEQFSCAPNALDDSAGPAALGHCPDIADK